MSEPRIGELRHLLSLQQPQREDDGGGGTVISWTLLAEVWCAVRAVRGNEKVLNGKRQDSVTHDVWMRWRAGVSPGMRLLFGARMLVICDVVEVGTPVRWLRCLAEEKVP